MSKKLSRKRLLKLGRKASGRRVSKRSRKLTLLESESPPHRMVRIQNQKTTRPLNKDELKTIVKSIVENTKALDILKDTVGSLIDKSHISLASCIGTEMMNEKLMQIFIKDIPVSEAQKIERFESAFARGVSLYNALKRKLQCAECERPPTMMENMKAIKVDMERTDVDIG